MRVVAICGSMRFWEAMQQAAWELETKRGYCILPCVMMPEGANVTQQDLDRLEEAHRKKIDLSDAIYVVNPGGYIGEAVRSEIEYAKSKGKEILFLVDPE